MLRFSIKKAFSFIVSEASLSVVITKYGSTNNNNFVVHPEKNVWHCFRCQTGGALSLIAVLEGVIQCNEAVAGGLRGDKLTERYGS